MKTQNDENPSCWWSRDEWSDECSERPPSHKRPLCQAQNKQNNGSETVTFVKTSSVFNTDHIYVIPLGTPVSDSCSTVIKQTLYTTINVLCETRKTGDVCSLIDSFM